MKHIQRITVILFALSVVLFIVTEIKLKADADNTIPVISCDIDTLQVSVNATEEELLEGLTAWDEKDGDLTANIMVGSVSKFVAPRTVNVTYVVFDRNNNSTEYTRKVEYLDYESPVFSLDGSLDFSLGKTVDVLTLLKATDSIDGDITHKIRLIYSGVNNSQLGTYTVTVQVSNDYGDTTEAELLVNINSNSSSGPAIKLNSYLVYLNRDEAFDPADYILSITDIYGQPIGEDLIQIDSDVNTGEPGFYQVTYTARDTSNRQTVVHMMVIVKEDLQNEQ